MIKKLISVIIAVNFLLCACACRGYKETDSEYFVSAVCFEKEEDKFKAYCEVLIISEENKNIGTKVFSGLGQTPYDAVSGVVALMPKIAVFDHCSTAIMSSNITGQDFKSVIKYLYDIRNLNLGIYLFAADDIGDILDCKVQTMSIGYDIMLVEKNTVKSTGLSFKNKYYETCSREIFTDGFCLPELDKKNDRPIISGQIIYSDYYPVEHLNKKETMIYNLLFSGSKGGEIDIGDKRCRVNSINSVVRAYDNTLEIKIHCRYRHASDDESKALKSEIEKLIERLYGNAALKALGVTSFDKINTSEVRVNGK